jgi:hypothetical protein
MGTPPTDGLPYQAPLFRLPAHGTFKEAPKVQEEGEQLELGM